MRWVFAYDISEDSKRARVSAVLSSWGDRVQKSVFECTIDDTELAELLTRVDDIIDHTSDRFDGYQQCAACTSSRILLGQAETYEEEPFWVV